MRLLLPLLALAVAVPLRATDKVDTSRALEQAEAVKKAVLDGDYARVADLTHPKIVAAMGGKDKIVAATKAVMAQMKAQGIEIKSYTIGKPGDPVADGTTAYVVLPTKMEMTGPKVMVRTESYLLGMTTDGGKTWTFADGSGLAKGPAREALLPDLPKALKLPDPKPPTVTKDPD